MSEKYGAIGTRMIEKEPKLQRLEKEECLILRPLWEEVFYEDSKAFTDYYFKEKAARNRAFVLQGQEGARAMLYLAPYAMEIRTGRQWTLRKINYIIGVATKKEYRHKGYMNRLLCEALQYMQEKKQPFTFLMPADPAIYQPYQFTYIYDRQEYEWRGYEGQKEEQALPDFMQEREIPFLKAFASAWLSEHMDVFIRRDEAYYQILLKELKAQNGGICLLREQHKISGYFLYTHEEEGEIQEAVYESGKRYPFARKADRKPIIMARIIDVKEMLSLLRTKEKEQEVILQVDDPIVKENSGEWHCLWQLHGAQIERMDGGRKAPKLYVTIEKLTAWVFGYRSVEECFEATEETADKEGRKLFDKLAQVKVLSRVFLNEIV